jgi:hypothetical protein
MPAPTEIITGLTYIANAWSGVAVAWHVAVAVLLIALIAGWKPTRRQLGVLLVLPLVSVSVFAWLAHNPFNGTLFAVAAAILVAIAAKLPDARVRRASNPIALLGFAMIGFGWVYPHFLEGGSSVRYLYAAPTGLIPCPTLSVAVGFALLAAGLGSRAWSAVLAATGLFYGLFGALRLGVYLDAGLITGSVALAVIALRPPEQCGTRAVREVSG